MSKQPQYSVYQTDGADAHEMMWDNSCTASQALKAVENMHPAIGSWHLFLIQVWGRCGCKWGFAAGRRQCLLAGCQTAAAQDSALGLSQLCALSLITGRPVSWHKPCSAVLAQSCCMVGLPALLYVWAGQITGQQGYKLALAPLCDAPCSGCCSGAEPCSM